MERLLCYMSSTHMHCRKDWIACLDSAKKMGFDGVELFSEENGVNLTDMPEERCIEIAEHAKRLELRIAVHPWVKWDEIPQSDLNTRYRAFTARCLRMGVKEINMHLHFLATRTQGMRRVLEATDACIDLIKGSDLTLLYENVPEHGHRELGSEIADFECLFEHYGAASNVMLNIDTGHAHIMHQTAPLCEKFGAQWKYTHINDNDGLHDLHLAPGSGTLDISVIAQAARYANYAGVLTMEYSEDGLNTGIPVIKSAYQSVGYVLAPFPKHIENSQLDSNAFMKGKNVTSGV